MYTTCIINKLQSLSEEHSSEIVQGIAEAYGEMLRVCHEKGKLADPPVHINQEQAYRLLQTILECLEKVLQRRREREKHAEELGEDYDEEVGNNDPKYWISTLREGDERITKACKYI